MTPSEIPRCENCLGRKKAEAKPRSILGILWRLHTKICPGWKLYQRWLKEHTQENPT